MASLLRFAYVMAVGRVVSGWRLEAVLFGSILLAVALMASGVIFSNLLANAALRGELVQAAPEDVNFWVRSFSSSDDPQDVEGRHRAFKNREVFVEQQLIEPFAPYLKEHSRYLETATFFFQGRPNLELDKDTRPRGPIAYLSGISERIRVVEGHWPEGTATSGQPLDVAVDRLGAELLQMGLGDVMEVFPATSFTEWPAAEVRIVAIFERVDPSDEFWYGLSSAASRQDDRWTLIPLFADEDALIERVLGTYPSLYTDTTWYFFPDRRKMLASEVEDVQVILAHIQGSLSTGLKNSSYSIRLDNLLRSFEEQLLLARLPLYLVLFLVTGILIYYLALVAGLIVRSRAGEIAMLKSRGAMVWQLGVLGLGEGLLLAVPAVIAGPFLALGVVKLLGVIFFELSGASDTLAGVPTGVSLEAFLLGLVGGGLAVLVFTVATLAAARRSGIEARQAGARPPTVSLLHRYYLDLVLLAVIGLVWWQLQSRGTFLVQSLGSRELTIDYSLLLGPALGLAAAGLIVLRLFPWAAAVLARLAGPVGPTWLVHVLRHLSRDPLTPAMLIVLVMLTTALGVMGSAFSSTLERGQRERALYEAGADLRIQHGGWNQPGGVAANRNTTLPSFPLPRGEGQGGGIAAAADAFRSPGYLTTTGFSTSGTLLAVEADNISDVAWFRDDFADGRSLTDLSLTLKYGISGNPNPLPEGEGISVSPPPQGEGREVVADGIPLPPDATALALWARPGGSARGVDLWARLRDSEGRVADARLGDLQDTQWSRFLFDLATPISSNEGIIGRSQSTVLKPPLELISLSVRSRFHEGAGGAAFFGRVEAETSSGVVTIHNFSSTDGWHVIEDFRKPGLYSLDLSQSAAAGEFDVTSRFSWASGGLGLIGIRAGGADEPIPALVSSEFLEVTDSEVGDTIILGLSTYALPLKIAAEVEFFPTLDPDDKPFAVVDLSRFTQAAMRYNPRPPRGPNELWLAAPRSSPPLYSPPERGKDRDGEGISAADAETVSAALREQGVSVRNVLHAPTMVALRVEQPLVNAGWGALLVLLFLAVALASASGLLLFSHLDARERQTEFALLRTLGISRGQMQRILWVNLFLMAVCGVGLGTLLGWLIGASVLPLMEVVEEGARATPSLVLTTDWQRLLVSYVILAVVTGLCGLWLTWVTAKLQLQQVLRMGE